MKRYCETFSTFYLGRMNRKSISNTYGKYIRVRYHIVSIIDIYIYIYLVRLDFRYLFNLETLYSTFTFFLKLYLCTHTKLYVKMIFIIHICIHELDILKTKISFTTNYLFYN